MTLRALLGREDAPTSDKKTQLRQNGGTLYRSHLDMRLFPWQLLFAFGLMLIIIHLLIDLLLPIGIILLIVSLVLWVQEKASKPRVIKK